MDNRKNKNDYRKGKVDCRRKRLVSMRSRVHSRRSSVDISRRSKKIKHFKTTTQGEYIKMVETIKIKNIKGVKKTERQS